jgi:diaminohydroxyphosphoribosylaminopyrimidine deaminase/5-amino-6-(5-phosphoribosylamino)uracil reductase
MVVGQIGQSLDGRIATPSGQANVVNGAAGLDHLHRLRALVDVVVVGVGTVLADNPRLTVRRVTGPNPARVVIDPRGRLAASARVFADDGVRRIVITAQGARYNGDAGAEIVTLPAVDGLIAPRDILAALATRGFRRVLIEGGAETIMRFLRAHCLDRLHVVVAPIIIGAGPLSFTLPVGGDGPLRPAIRVVPLGDEMLFDCDFSHQRVVLDLAKKST